MALDDFKDFPINLLLAGLFLVCIVSFAIGIGHNYGKSSDIMKTEYIDMSRIETQINQTSQSANSWAESFKSDNLFVSAGAIILFSIWGVIKLVWDACITFVVIYLDLFASLFGVPSIVIGVITAIVLISLIFLGWKVVKQGG